MNNRIKLNLKDLIKNKLLQMKVKLEKKKRCYQSHPTRKINQGMLDLLILEEENEFHLLLNNIN